ncbi:BEL1-like homeodomain protein 9 [Populus nigra]|uniref:BEL1-like homeodomain protein 9 n=1 Tax=Populus nigra TaxID=3691 RepID=UPI002B2749A6|nr:BEL1-like homeodomain protein 9 [Populus nigra]
MAQNFEPFHVPQQNRKNKLRVTTQPNQEQQNPPTPLFSRQAAPMNPSQSSSFSSLQTLKDMSYQPLTSQGLSLCLSFQLDNQRYNAVSVSGDYTKQNGEMRSSVVPLGPFTGYASILTSSRFLKPAQQILDEICGVINCANANFPLDGLGESEITRESIAFLSGGVEHQWKNSKLILMLDEVYRRYKLYCQQMQSVVASFETVAGLGNAAPYVCYAIKIVLKHFTSLKNALLDKIQFTGRTFADSIVTKEKSPRYGKTERGIVNPNPTLNLNFIQHSVWRSQRGLPDHAVAVLKTWLFEHFLHPYPTDSEKQALAQQTGLSRTQVSNWFINARVRLWKPMVEEVHMLESQQTQAPSETVNQGANTPSDLPLKKQPRSTPHQNTNQMARTHSRNELPDVSKQRQDPVNIYGNNLSGNHHSAGVSGSKGVSLALGLPQNNGIDLSWPLPMSMPHHVNVEMIGMMDSAPATGFELEKQHFRKE